MCAFNEFHPQVSSAGVLLKALLLPAMELPPQRRSLAGRERNRRKIRLRRDLRRSRGNPSFQNEISVP